MMADDTLTSIGHNTEAGRKLAAYVARIERIADDKAGLSEDMRNEFTAAKSEGFDPKVMRQAIRLRKMERAVRDEAAAMLDTYMHALGE